MSTRGAALPESRWSFAEALRLVVPPGGGLFVPAGLRRDSRPPAELGPDTIHSPRSAKPSPDRAPTASVLARFTAPGVDAAGQICPGLDTPALERLLADAIDFEIPLVPFDLGSGRNGSGDSWLLDLTRGPTGAFKDVGARALARLLAALAPGERRTVVVATSGDTGGAVAAAFHGFAHTRVFVLYPRDGVSDLQRRQLTTPGGNVHALEVDGPFDVCQALVRAALADPALCAEHGLTSANSIGVGRLLPQMAWYLDAARELGRLGVDAPPTFVVPSGNLGNLVAGVMAARSSVPGARFVAALNRNDPLRVWLTGGGIDPARATVRTPSNAMDVAAPSNLERLVWLAGGDPAVLDGEVAAVTVDDEATLDEMGRIHAATGRFVCPHTAVGLRVARTMRAHGHAGPLVVLETAHAAKFDDVVRAATGHGAPLPASLAGLSARPERRRVLVPTLAAFSEVLTTTEWD